MLLPPWLLQKRNKLPGSSASKLLHRALEIKPDSHEAYYELARIDCDREQWSEAVDALRKAIDLAPYEAQYYYLLGRAYRRLGRLEESKAALDNYFSHRGKQKLFGEEDSAPTPVPQSP